ncbi:MAG TPA: LPS export ABC transporter periplasmic protein LptC [Bryobacteraceae bacterium]|nr:LPS export ABC transporter periplasmic protein LptC [Bryobacteraceae bacterium]
MRRGRWLILAAILSIVGFVGVTYLNRMRTLKQETPVPPAPLDLSLESRADNWCYTQTDGGRPKVKVCAAAFKQIKQPPSMDLTGVSLWLYHEDGSQYDLVKSEKAQFDIANKTLYSDGDVEITLGMDAAGSPAHGRLIGIHTSGVRFASDTGVATTDRPTTFEFEQGGGSATGADYNPNTRELHLHSHVVLDWRGKSPQSKPMHIEAGEAFYRERQQKIALQPWSKLTRGSLSLEGGTSLVSLDNGNIQHADVQAGRGVQDEPGRKVEFGAGQLALDFGDSMLIRQIEGRENARLVSTSSTVRTTITANKLDLGFIIAQGESTLSTSNASGNSVAESVPLNQPASRTPETRVLRSDAIQLKMRPGGKEIASVETAGPGTLDFLPNRPGQPKRNLKGDRIWIDYGADNRIQAFRSMNVHTRTDKPAVKGKPAPPPALTQSKDFLAKFDPTTSQLTSVEQKTDFQYQEGSRQARADRATLDDKAELMTLYGAASSGQARVWDPMGSATADRIVLNQKTGDFTADGHVGSTRQPDGQSKSAGQSSGSGMLSADEVLQARAQHMTSTTHNTKIHYEGNAVAWQGANRVEAQTLDIDRGNQTMKAHGHVVSQLADKKQGTQTAPVFTVVRAPDLSYSDSTRVALYKGGAQLTRPGLTVTSQELRAFLENSNAGSSLDKAFADGKVKIVSTTAGPGVVERTRTGTSEHAEYYAKEGKVILQGGAPLLIDSLRGRTTGKQLTWWANSDRLLVNGAENTPAKSVLRKKK